VYDPRRPTLSVRRFAGGTDCRTAHATSVLPYQVIRDTVRSRLFGVGTRAFECARNVTDSPATDRRSAVVLVTLNFASSGACAARVAHGSLHVGSNSPKRKKMDTCEHPNEHGSILRPVSRFTQITACEKTPPRASQSNPVRLVVVAGGPATTTNPGSEDLAKRREGQLGRSRLIVVLLRKTW
jgi:hypothetical protein